MNYSLGNMLNGGESLNADGLSLNLQFATDKTLTARKGPTPTFTRASTATFVGSDGLIQSAAINQARFDHNPITLACRGLLIEESRTNLVNYSQDFTQSFYGKIAASISSVSGTSPSGETTIQKIVEDTSTGGHGIEWFLGSTGTFTLSAFLKAEGRQWARFTLSSLSTWFDLQNGVIGTIAAGQTASITNFGNGWYRCTVTFTTTAASSVLIRIATGNNNTIYTGDGASGIFAWGAQLETGAFPTSYIPTTTASVVRSADLCSITGSDFTGFYNQSEGTIVGSGLTNSPTTNAGPELFRASDGTNNNRVQIGMTNFPAQAVRPFITASGTTTYSSTQGTATVGVERKVGMAYKTNDTISAFNGTLGTLDTTVTPPTNCNQVALFSGLGAGTISSLRYYKKRLANAKLQTLTT